MAANVKGMFKDYVDDDEVLLGTIHKHPFGIIIVYLQAIAGLLLAVGLAIFLLPQVIPDTDTAYSIAIGFTAMAVFFTFLVVIASTIIYRQSSIVITDKNITQILQSGLFGRKVSQLTMANVEDVTAVQHGIFATMFDFGELKIETAGEQANFIFGYCPRPGYYAKIILEAREKFISHDFPYAAANQGQLGAAPQMAQPQQPQPQPPQPQQPTLPQQPAGVTPPQTPPQDQNPQA